MKNWLQQGIYDMATKTLKTSELPLTNFCAKTKFRFSKPSLHKYPKPLA